MKYTVAFIALLLTFAGCASSEKKQTEAVYTTQHQNESIIDEEFDLLVAPEYNYDSAVPYESQIKVQPVTKSTAKKTKPSTKPKAIKQ